MFHYFFSSFFSSFLLRLLLIFKISFLNVSVEKAIRKFFPFVLFSWKSLSLVFSSSSFLLSSHQIKLRCLFVTENKAQNKQNSFLKKNSNDAESAHFDVFSSSLSFDHSKSNDQKKSKFFWWFFNRRNKLKNNVSSNLMWILRALRKSDGFLRFFFESINCQRCEKNKNECVSINFYIFQKFQKLFFY